MKTFEREDPSLEGVGWIPDSGPCSGAYVLHGGRTLIDTGNMLGLVDELRDMGPVEKLERILLTHAHFDHVGGMAEIYQVTAPDLIVHKLTREYLRLLRPPFPEFFQSLEEAGKVHCVEDGDVVDSDPPLEVCHLPGHTAGDLAFYWRDAGALFCGDAVLPHKVRFAAILSKPDEVLGGRMQDKVDSLKRLLSLPVRHLFPGHGEPVLHKGDQQVKIALVTLYQALYPEPPEKAWLLMAGDLLDAGQPHEARQCWEKARSLAPDSVEAARLADRFDLQDD
ncbi:Glyoxylase, beta-lactamase superfamily II [Desulfacinum hydrothermale DSM 13146]|uniref:Glyoxylase, beta-lactamase superfamily II n=1 Tax=Desulfacinum hydrothermale DSM 13146 TaxID=1121390 RepID=A0A1W1XPX3_9BACT|nr:MBL fold metallo-hydrolase [Desulfacinum hydrothermale]SMC25581.1 Glyoxylase, beta-lactamase superfamily II [Desulfacinum hydrothermale DSM 13146]